MTRLSQSGMIFAARIWRGRADVSRAGSHRTGVGRAGLMDKPELAVFGVCARVFALAAFGVTAIHMVLLLGLMEADTRRDEPTFRQRLGDANLAATGAAVALTLAALAGGPILLALFGPGFEAGRWPLVILCLALVVRSFFSPAELVLSLNNRPWAAMPAIAAGLMSLLSRAGSHRAAAIK